MARRGCGGGEATTAAWRKCKGLRPKAPLAAIAAAAAAAAAAMPELKGNDEPIVCRIERPRALRHIFAPVPLVTRGFITATS